jgi:hypothetical protein
MRNCTQCRHFGFFSERTDHNFMNNRFFCSEIRINFYLFMDKTKSILEKIQETNFHCELFNTLKEAD